MSNQKKVCFISKFCPKKQEILSEKCRVIFFLINKVSRICKQLLSDTDELRYLVWDKTFLVWGFSRALKEITLHSITPMLNRVPLVILISLSNKIYLKMVMVFYFQREYSKSTHLTNRFVTQLNLKSCQLERQLRTWKERIVPHLFTVPKELFTVWNFHCNRYHSCRRQLFILAFLNTKISLKSTKRVLKKST